jgi:ribonuclease E
MLIDAVHPEQTRVAVVDGRRLEEFDFETLSRKQLKGNIYLAKVVRIEPSLQAAFVEYGGNRHGFLAFTEIHPDYYRIPIADRQELEAAIAEERAAREHHDDQPYAPFPDAPFVEQQQGEEDLNAPFVDEEIEESHITQSALPPAIGLGAPDSGLITEPFSSSEPEADNDFSEEGDDDEDEDEGEEEPANGNLPPETPMGGAPEGAVPVESVGGDTDVETHREQQRRRRFIRRYKIQEVIKRGQIMLIQVVKEERGNKGAALTTYLSLAGRYCVLMPNTGKGGGVSRKITNMQDRRRMKELLADLETPDGMAVILRTAGIERGKIEVRRDLEYLLRLWDSIREHTLGSIAPCLIYEEANLIKRAIRDLYTPDIESVLVEGEDGHKRAYDFMRMLMPSHAERIIHYKDPVIPLFFRYQVENQINALHSPTVRLRSGGYIVINQTEALVAIDVNSGRSTRERNIEETASRTNLEAAEEVARQLRLRDLAGLIVIDFIDMEDSRNNHAVERRLKEAMRHDRARLQIGRISHFGLLELSRQRLRPSLLDLNFEKCAHCHGTGNIRSVESTALLALHALEEEGIRQSASEIIISMPTQAAQYILNNKRDALTSVERRYGMNVRIRNQDDVIPPEFPIERVRGKKAEEQVPINLSISDEKLYAAADRHIGGEGEGAEGEEGFVPRERGADGAEGEESSGGRRFEGGEGGEGGDRPRRRRGRRGGRRRGRDRFREGGTDQPPQAGGQFPADPDAPMAEGADNIGNVAAPGDELAPQGEGFRPRENNFQPRGDRGDRGDRGPRGEGRGDRGGRGGDRGGRRGGRDRDRGPRDNRDNRGSGERNFNRPPRDPNYQGDDNRGNRMPPVPAPFAPNVPGSVFELDTTPREPGSYSPPPAPPQQQQRYEQPRQQQEQRPQQQRPPQQHQAYTPQQQSSAPPAAPTVSDQGLDPSEKKKGGWWQKLTGSS